MSPAGHSGPVRSAAALGPIRCRSVPTGSRAPAWRALCLLAALSAAGPARGACLGDCDGDQRVVVTEIVTAIAITLGTRLLSACRATDRDGDGAIGIDELLGAVSSALRGCPETARFTDVTAAAGLTYAHGYRDELLTDARLVAGGVAVGDYDGDGWLDLFAVQGDRGPDLLFRNQGDGTFAEVGAAAGIARTGRRGTGPIFADVDGDGWLDLLVLGFDGTPPILYRNRGNGTFTDVTARSGLAGVGDGIGAAFGDIDADGDLDLFVAHWNTVRHVDASTFSLWRNEGGGVFSDVSRASGVSAAIGRRPPGAEYTVDYTFTPNFADIDDDGDLDLLLAADFGTSRVLRNQGDGTFIDVTTAVISDENGMGAAVGDYDNDGHLDWFVSSIADPDGVPEGFWGTTGNRMYRNRGDGTFEDRTDRAGVREGFWGWGSTFADLNNDGWLDLCHVNGYGPLHDPASAEFHFDPTRVFLSRRDGTFREVSAALGIEDHGQGRGIVAFDYDRDGDLDLFVANAEQPPLLLRNDAGIARHWLTVILHGARPNTQAIGARVTVAAPGMRQMRELRAGSNYVSQDPAEAHFGLDDLSTVAVTVRWPGGTATQLPGTTADRVLHVVQP